MDVIPRIPVLYDEPFSDPSQFPTVIVSNLAPRDVTVALSGDGGDELFGGYDRYLRTRTLWRLRSATPRPLRPSFQRAFRTGGACWEQPVRLAHKLRQLDVILACESAEGLYYRRLWHWPRPETVVREGREPATIILEPAPWPEDSDLESRTMAIDSLTCLPDDILVKVDRAAMDACLEAHTPFLDHRVVEFACRLPQSLKIRRRLAKWILRPVLQKYIPKDLVDGPKKGISVPIGDWLRGLLRDWTEVLLSEQHLEAAGFLHASPIRYKWEEHVSGRRDWAGPLWNVLMFQAWLHSQPKAQRRRS